MTLLTYHDAYAMRRGLAKLPIGDVPLSPAMALLLNGLDCSTPDGWQTLSNLVSANPEISRQVLQIDPKQPLSKPADEVYIPSLPVYATPKDSDIKAAAAACRWHDDFVAWAIKRSPMTPPLVLEAGAVYLLGVAIARRVCLQVHDRIYPHLYMLWIAETTRYAKSTGLKAVSEVARAAIPHMLLPQTATPEALLEAMAGEMPENFDRLNARDRARLERGQRFAAQRALIIDEASSLLGATKKDYMAGLQEFMLEAYDAPEIKERNTRGGGLVIVHRLALSILGATTPAAMARTVTADKWEDGEMARYALLFPDGYQPYDDTFGDYDPPDHVVRQLALLHTRLPEPPLMALDTGNTPDQVTVFAGIAPEVLKAFKGYRRALTELVNADLDMRLHGNYGRLPVQVLKVAMSFAAMDWCTQQAEGNPLRIEMPHWTKALLIVEKWRGSLHRLIPVLTESQDSRAQARILTILTHAPSGLTARDISKRIG